MISISKLTADIDRYGDKLRYTENSHKTATGCAESLGPVVVWNCTKACNLNCLHCYSNSNSLNSDNELTTQQAEKFIAQLRSFNVPVLLISGGEPFLREDIIHLTRYALSLKLRVAFSSNGTLITKRAAKKLKEIGVSYVGISLDGTDKVNDMFRGKENAFLEAVNGIRNCLKVGLKTGLRITVSKHNYSNLNELFKFIKEEKIPRACFYHLVHVGRGRNLISEDISNSEKRQLLDFIIEKTFELNNSYFTAEVLTVDNHCDGVYTYLKLREFNLYERAEKSLKLLKMSGGNRSGIAISNVDWNGNVHPDQFTQNYILGNVTEKEFGKIWNSSLHPILKGLRNRKSLLKGRCSKCIWLNCCNGNLRARAEILTGDFWGSDPACYLTDYEIGLK